MPNGFWKRFQIGRISELNQSLWFLMSLQNSFFYLKKLKRIMMKIDITNLFLYLRSYNMPFSITHIRDLINDQLATLKNGATYIKHIFMKE